MARPAKPASAIASSAGCKNNKRISKTKTQTKTGNKRTLPPKRKVRAAVEAQDTKDEGGNADGEWEVARISHIRHAARFTNDNEGYEYLVHWAAPGYAPTWTATALIGPVALHQFWIGGEGVVIHAAGYQPGEPEPASAVAASAAHAQESPCASDEVGESPGASVSTSKIPCAVSKVLLETSPTLDQAQELPRTPDQVLQSSCTKEEER